MEQIEQFCNYFYKDSLIPVYIYKNRTLFAAFPEQSTLTYPPIFYLNNLWHLSSPISYISTNFNSFFGCIQLNEDPDLIIVIGPITNVPYSTDVYHLMHQEYVISIDNQKKFNSFFSEITIMTLTSFLNKLLFFNFTLNHTPLLLSDIINLNSSNDFSHVANQQAESMYTNKINGSYNNSYEIEQKLTHIIEDGNIKEFENYVANSPAVHEGIIAPNAIRQAKNTGIVMITLATRAAIRGGVPTDIAFQLSDLYIQELEQLTTISSIYQLNYDVFYDFTYRVSISQTPITNNDVIQKAIQFIIKNTNFPLTVSDVANHLGFSRSYFSHRFKQELGFNLRTFIIRCKLEESKYLLSYTNKSISDISNYLCFSSQSHFQTTFKKQYGITPMEYRKNTINN